MYKIFLHKNSFTTASAQKFVPDTSGSCKQIECRFFFEIIPVFENIEQAFLGNICGWPRLETFPGIKNPAFEFSSDNSHFNLVFVQETDAAG